MSTTMRESTPFTTDRIVVERWPTEKRLATVCGVIGLGAWIILTITIVGLIYALMIGAFLFVTHVLFVAHVRGSGVRVGPDQFPDLHARVEHIGQRMGMQRVPEVYLMQAGGALNALATRFLRTNFLVLFSDLLEACGENEAARDMIIAHELGHLHAGHLRFRWLLLPGTMIPFLGTALSRAREYTCDRYGFAAAGDSDAALLGLTILAAGGKYGPRVNRHALVAQRAHLETGWMTIGEWLSTHPPVAKRLLALDRSLDAGIRNVGAGKFRALAIIAAIIITPFVVATYLLFAGAPGLLENLGSGAALSNPETVEQPSSMPRADFSGDAAAALEPTHRGFAAQFILSSSGPDGSPTRRTTSCSTHHGAAALPLVGCG